MAAETNPSMRTIVPAFVISSVFSAVGVMLLAALVASSTPSLADEPPSLLLATTTSVQDSGLLDRLIPTFTEQTGIRVRAVAVGTGAALRMGAEGNVDTLLTHAPSAERKLLSEGSIESRVEIMENFFVLAGPASDPADVRHAKDIGDALRRIVSRGAPFVSRGDDSGTHKREAQLFRDAGLDPGSRFARLTRTGSGMGLSLQVAGEKQAYILSDIGTFLAFRERTGLQALSGNDESLRNVYSLLRVSRARFPKVRSEQAARLEGFFTSAESRMVIASFGVERFGRPLFVPTVSASSP
jgi:tungstate transport system substrate-binding protein